jgi:ankyrin repeat protein
MLNNIFNKHSLEGEHFLNKGDSFSGRTALHLAALMGNLPAIQLLIKHGANVQALDKCGFTALHYACAMNAKVVYSQQYEAFQKNGFLSLNNGSEYKELSPSSFFRSIQLQIIRELLRNGDLFDKVSHTKKTALHVLMDLNSNTDNDEQSRSLFLEIIQVLSLNINDQRNFLSIFQVRDDLGWTALDISIYKCNILAASHLCSLGAVADNMDNNGEYTIHKAASTGNIEILKLVLMNGADVNATDRENNNTALLICVCNRFVDCTKLLLQYGADITICDKQNRNVLHFATYMADYETVELLLEYIHNHKSQKHTKLPSCDSLGTNNYGTTPLHIAARSGDVKLCQIFLNQYYSSSKSAHQLANLHMVDEKGRTPFMEAARLDRLDILDLFFEHQKKVNESLCEKLVNQTDFDGNSSLHLAAGESGQISIIQWLISHGANVNQVNTLKQTPVVRSCISRYWDAAVYLLQQKEQPCNIMHALEYIALLFENMQYERDQVRNLVEKNKELESENIQLRSQLQSYSINNSSLFKQFQQISNIPCDMEASEIVVSIKKLKDKKKKKKDNNLTIGDNIFGKSNILEPLNHNLNALSFHTDNSKSSNDPQLFSNNSKKEENYLFEATDVYTNSNSYLSEGAATQKIEELPSVDHNKANNMYVGHIQKKPSSLPVKSRISQKPQQNQISFDVLLNLEDTQPLYDVPKSGKKHRRRRKRPG